MWSGDEWQQYCSQLLALRHGESYQRVPDRDRGDFGIEGFTSDGLLYQCYAAQDPLSPGDLYSKQRDKMTADLKKLQDNDATIARLTRPCKIRIWVLLVPRCDTKRLIEHASEKAEQLRSAGLESLDPNFVVRVLTSDDFQPEVSKLEVVARALLPSTLEPSNEEVDSWPDQDPTGAEKLGRKVEALDGENESDRRSQLLNAFIRHYLQAAAMGDTLRRLHPQVWERLNHEREARERVLAAAQLLNQSQAGNTIISEVDLMHARIESVIPPLAGGQAEQLAWGIVAEWLIRCPLEPSPAAGAA